MNLFRKKSVATILKNAADESAHGATGLAKSLKVKDLTALGIAAIVGAGIFSTIGTASANGGPAVILLFIFTAVACGFSAFAYAEFASMVPVAGSAYTYSYVAFGEIIAWLIGWSLIMEYSIGNIAVAISWSDYFTGLLSGIGWDIPTYFTMDYLSAYKANIAFTDAIAKGIDPKTLENAANIATGNQAWTTAPQIFGLHLIADLPALLIIILITRLVYKGISESKKASNMMVLIKLCIILVVIAVGAFYVNPTNWSPFAPNGITGILKGISAVFFAYIGFDAISTTAEECENPQRDLPKGMMYSIIICTVLYVAIALILTGMVNYSLLNVGDPLAFVFEKVGVHKLSGIIAVSAVVAMASVLLVFQLGQPRIWLSMSRDGLLPKAFSKIHPKFKTPSFATIITGLVVAIPALFLNLTAVTDLCSIGTLFAFVLVCAGVLKLQATNDPSREQAKFKTPYMNAQYIYPVALIIVIGIAFTQFKTETVNFLQSKKVKTASETIASLNENQLNQLAQQINFKEEVGVDHKDDLINYTSQLKEEELTMAISKLNLTDEQAFNSGWDVFKHNIPYWSLWIILLLLAYYAFRYKLSLIPLLGLTSCLYMISEMGLSNWIGFGIWLLLGIIIYFLYGYKNSRLALSK